MKFLTLVITLLISQAIHARSHVIFSMAQDLPMGFDNEVIRKNYYVNMGTGQGIKKDTILDVYRIVSVQNPYDNQKRVNYKVKVGELKVLHTSEEASIASVKTYQTTVDTPILELNQFMIGDHVSINVD